MTRVALSPIQHTVLLHAIEHTLGKVVWFPETTPAGARKKVLEALSNKGLITASDSEWWVATPGYTAVERHPPEESSTGVAEEATQELPKQPVKPVRAESKQARVLAMLRRPEGATIAQICTAMEWQAHTVRGAFAGAFKKKLGLTITSEKTVGGERIYRIGQSDQLA